MTKLLYKPGDWVECQVIYGNQLLRIFDSTMQDRFRDGYKIRSFRIFATYDDRNPLTYLIEVDNNYEGYPAKSFSYGIKYFKTYREDPKSDWPDIKLTATRQNNVLGKGRKPKCKECF